MAGPTSAVSSRRRRQQQRSAAAEIEAERPRRLQKMQQRTTVATTSRSAHNRFPFVVVAIVVVGLILEHSNSASSFPLVSQPVSSSSSLSVPFAGNKRRSKLFLTGSNSSQEEIDRQLEKARAVLAISRAKLGASSSAAEDDIAETEDPIEQQQRRGAIASNVPFFATTTPGGDSTSHKKKEKVIKNKNKETGLFTTDGDLMAKLSEQEEWEPRPLLEVFRNERKASSTDKDSLADRDVAASIFNLRKSLQLEDYQKIFDTRNRFIGEQ